MSKVSITRSLLDDLAVSISNKSGEAVPMTLTEMKDAVDSIQTGGTLITKSITQNGTYSAQDDNADGYSSVNVSVSAPAPTLQTKTHTVDSAGTTTVTADSGYDGLSSVAVSVPSASPFMGTSSETFVTEGGERKWKANVFTEVNVSEGDIEGWLPDGYHQDFSFTRTAVPSNTTITPTTSAQTIGGAKYMMEGAVTVNAMPSGTAGTPTATKGTVSNHSVSVTPSVTNTTGYITGSTKTGTAVTVSASELVSGSETKTANGTYDVTNLAQLVVNVASGSSKNTQVVQGTTRTTSSTLTAIGAELTVSKTGTYDVYWSAFRSNTSGSYTFGSQLFIDNVAYGTENTTWSNHIQNNHLQNVSLTANQKIRVRGRNSRGSSYYLYAPTLVIVEA